MLTALVLVAGCAPLPQRPAAAWSQVALPDGAHPTSMTAAGRELLVGGTTGSSPDSGQSSGSSPWLARVSDGVVSGAVDMAPAEPYAEVADLISLTVAGDTVYAIGEANGGAHSNPRRTVWDGSLSANRLTSRPQEFFTFGGHDAGTLFGTVVLDDSPVIFGTRADTYGIRGSLWTRTEETWHEQPRTDPVLTSNQDREVGFGAVTASKGRLVVVGDELGLARGLRQSPLLLTGTVAGSWSQTLLPIPQDLPVVPGQLSGASGIGCGNDGTCWVAGWVRGHVLVWHVTVGADGSEGAGAASVLPGMPPDGNGPRTLVTLAGDRPFVLTNAVASTLQVRCGDAWQQYAAPPGVATAFVAMPDALYAVAADALWRFPVPSC